MNDEKSFKIKDKRVFDSTGEVRDPQLLKDETHKGPPKQPEEKKSEKPQTKHEKRHFDPVRVDFVTFVTSMYTSGAMHLGLIPDPVNGGTETDTGLARQDIDILEMLEEKTKGNLDEKESRILENALYDLRVKYVELSKKRN